MVKNPNCPQVFNVRLLMITDFCEPEVLFIKHIDDRVVIHVIDKGSEKEDELNTYPTVRIKGVFLFSDSHIRTPILTAIGFQFIGIRGGT